MWKKNYDTGKWDPEIDSLSKENYDFYKQEYSKVKLYSKCLSGSTYLTINNFEDLYPELRIKRLGFFAGTVSIIPRGPTISISSNSDEFYNKYLLENGFTLKNLFTPERILQEQGVNFKYVDFATTESIKFESNNNLIIDNIPVKSGQRVLVKDQTTVANLPIATNEVNYFINQITVSNYYFLDSNSTQKNYYYYNSENGVYKYNGSTLEKESDLSTYKGSYKYSVYVQNGALNMGKEFHLERTKFGYFPTDGYPVEFQEKKNWTLRHRVDYNNIFELNYYDATGHTASLIYNEKDSRTYSIPQRVITVGEFGAILNTQDKQTINGTWSYSNLIKNKFKVQLNCVQDTKKYYWICGNEGTLLKVDKITLEVEKVELYEDLDLMSIDFYGEQFAWVVGKFNTIYYTRDFGKKWTKLTIPEFDKYSYTKVIHLNENNVYVGGEAGAFIEFTWMGGVWSSYDRVITREVNKYDSYILSDDITDMIGAEWSTIKSTTFSRDRNAVFPDTIVYTAQMFGADYYDGGFQQTYPGYRTIIFNVSSPYFAGKNFDKSWLFIGFSMSNTQNPPFTYSRNGFNGPNVLTGDNPSTSPNGPNNFQNMTNNVEYWNKGTGVSNRPPNVVFPGNDLNPYQVLGFGARKAWIVLPIDKFGNVVDDTYTLDIMVKWNYDHINDTTKNVSNVTLPLAWTMSRYTLQTKKGELIIFSTNNAGLICYDIDNSISDYSNKFIHLTFTQTTSDIKTLARVPTGQDIYLGAERMYAFKLIDIFRFQDPVVNQSHITLTQSEDIYVNKLRGIRSDFRNNDWTAFPTYSLIIAGNNGMNRYLNTTNVIAGGSVAPTASNPLDPTFNSRFRSKLLILDYDVASKLNFFTDDGDYRLPISVTISRESFTISNTKVIMTSTFSELSWMDYSKDSEKTFRYLTNFGENNVIRYSSTFSYLPLFTGFRINSSRIGRTQSNFGTTLNNSVAPHLLSATSSKFMVDSRAITNSFSYTGLNLLLNKDIGICIRSFSSLALSDQQLTELGDVLNLSSTVIDINVVVNRIEYFQGPAWTSGTITLTKLPGRQAPAGGQLLYEFYYFYSTLNDGITAELTTGNLNVTITNLNKYSDLPNLLNQINLHPVGKGYGFTISGASVEISAKFNEKTAYYNQQLFVRAGNSNVILRYPQTFLDFGYSPTYNLLGYLSRIDPFAFTASKTFSISTTFSTTGIPNVLPGWTRDRTYYNNFPLVGRTESNVLKFGENLRTQWQSLLKNTFVDLRTVTGGVVTFDLSELFIIDKYEEPAIFVTTPGGSLTVSGTAYVVEFHKQLPLSGNIDRYDFRPRMGLRQISQDLQYLNNIHSATVSKSVRGFNFNDFSAKYINKFPTDTYMKILVSDFDIRSKLTAILYTDQNYNLALSVLNLDKENTLRMSFVRREATVATNLVNKLIVNRLNQPVERHWTYSINVGDPVYVDLNDSVGNAYYAGWTTVLAKTNYLTLATNVPLLSNTADYPDLATFSYFNRDPFFNYQPIDVFKSGLDLKVSRSIEILPQSISQKGNTFSLIDVDLNRYKLEFLDGLSLEEVFNNNHWVLEAEVSNVKLGKNPLTNKLIWYSGTFRCGRWFDATWLSGRWLSGDWYSGEWNSYPIRNNQIFDNSLTNEQDPRHSIWYSGRWFDGTWNGGTWYGGRRYAGDWNSGIWRNGIWNDGNWNNGLFTGGIWILGTWRGGKFNCDTKPAFWLDGKFISGDFENGMWYNGQFGNNEGLQSRFGTRSSNNRTSTWHAGNWINGDFHSTLNIDRDTNLPKVSKVHKFSTWRTGLWSNGNFYGGIAYNINFKGGVWHGGILEGIQVIGIDKVSNANDPMPITPPTNRIYLNGIFKFNPGDEIWIIDNKSGATFSYLGSDASPRGYLVNQISEDEFNKITGVYLNYNLDSLFPPLVNVVPALYVTYSYEFGNLGDMGISVVSKFTDARWRSGLWLNGYFDGGQYDGGIWYNGVFDGDWGN